MFSQLNIKKVVLLLVLIMVSSFVLAAALGSLSIGRLYFWGSLTETVDEERASELAGVTEISIKTESTAITLIPVDGNEILVHLYGRVSQGAEPVLAADKNNNRITIKVESKPRILVLTPNRLQLDVYLPAGYSERLVIETVSGSTTVSELNLDSFSFKSVSGNLQASAITAPDIETRTTSGRVKAANLEGDLRFTSVSGALQVESINSSNTVLRTTSGNVVINCFAGDLNFRSVSGALDVFYREFNNDIVVNTTSGRIKIKLPAEAEFHLNAVTVSGKIESSFPITAARSGRNYLEGRVGGAGNYIDIKTVSGNIQVAR